MQVPWSQNFPFHEFTIFHSTINLRVSSIYKIVMPYPILIIELHSKQKKKEKKTEWLEILISLTHLSHKIIFHFSINLWDTLFIASNILSLYFFYVFKYKPALYTSFQEWRKVPIHF